MQQKDLNIHINVLGWLKIVGNGIFLVIGFMGLFFFAGIGLVLNDPTVFPILTLVGGAGAVFFTLLAIPGMVAGYGLLKRENWARILALVLGFFDLLNFPLGTAAAVYTFWVLLQPEIEEYFSLLKQA